ncbi:MAG: S8 family serine peptidase [Halobacteriaceae archaeon]
MGEMNVKRRDLLRAGGVALGGFVATGSAAGRETVEVNVGYSAPGGRRAARSAAASVVREFSFDAMTIRVAPQAIAGLRNRPDVRYVEENGTMHALAQDLPWGVDRVDAEVANANGKTGNGADVAIIDTGIDSDHPDLQANLGAGKAFVSCKGGPKDCRRSWDDDDGHGTHCAGIADAIDNNEGVVGVSTQATLHAVKVLDNRGSGTFSDVAAGIEYVADQGWDVGSMSLGASSGSRAVKDACQYAYGKGVLLVAAAGNSGPCTDCVGYPAAYSEVVAVSSTTKNDTLSGFSSTGSEVEIAAPGSNIYSTYAGGGYATLSGTSMACPHVSGAGGQLMANGYTNTEARSRLKNTAENVGLSSNESGAGLLDVAAALGYDSSDDLGGGSTDPAPTVTTDAPTNVGDTSATLNGTLSDLGGANSADCYFEYRESGASSWTSTAAQTLSSTGSFNASVDGLSAGTDYEYRAVADASDGQSDTGGVVTFTTSGGGSGSAPTVDSVSVSETETPSPHAEFSASWSVSDADGDLSSVTVELTDETTSSVEETVTADVSGGSADGTTSLRAHKDDGSGHTYEVAVTASDAAGNTSATATETISES